MILVHGLYQSALMDDNNNIILLPGTLLRRFKHFVDRNPIHDLAISSLETLPLKVRDQFIDISQSKYIGTAYYDVRHTDIQLHINKCVIGLTMDNIQNSKFENLLNNDNLGTETDICGSLNNCNVNNLQTYYGVALVSENMFINNINAGMKLYNHREIIYQLKYQLHVQYLIIIIIHNIIR